jgi:O-methyltransferase domain
LADHVGAEPVGADAVAAAARSDPGATYRLLRALARIGIFEEHPGGSFSANDMSDALRSDAPGSIQPWAEFVGGPGHWRYWGDLLHAVRTGEDAPRHLDGASIWEVRADDPDLNRLFNAAMSALSTGAIPAIVDGYDFGAFQRLVDLGGGNGTLLAALVRAHPRLNGVLFDLPHVVAGATPELASADLAARVEIVAGNFLTDPIPAGADCYVLKSVLTDSDDDEVRLILARVHDVMSTTSRALIIDGVVPTIGGEPSEALFDLNMLVLTGGRNRTLEEWTELSAAARLRVVASHPTTSRFSVIELART